MPDRLNWDHLRIFLATERAGSLRSAAAAIGVNHATVRRAIAQLEADLGTRLFDRSPEGLALTHPGEELLVHAAEIEATAGRITRRLTGFEAIPAGTIRVSLPPSFAQGFFMPILSEFSELYPDIDVQLIATNQISNLSLHEADISIRGAREVEDDVVGRRLFQYETMAYASPAYLARHPGLASGDGSEAAWIGWSSENTWLRTCPFPEARVRHILPEIFLQIEAAAAGMGMLWIPSMLGDRDPRIQRIPGVVPMPERSVWLLLHRDLRKTARVRAFVDHMAAYVKRNKHLFAPRQSLPKPAP